MNLRHAKNSDLSAILHISEIAFPDEENTAIKSLVTNLLAETTTPATLSLVAELDDEVIGYIFFSPIYVEGGSNITGYILSPVAVAPDHQNKGCGVKLINKGKQVLSTQNVDAILVYGDPAYYGKFGFNEEAGSHFVPPYLLSFPVGWQGLMLTDKALEDAQTGFTCVNALSKPDLW